MIDILTVKTVMLYNVVLDVYIQTIYILCLIIVIFSVFIL